MASRLSVSPGWATWFGDPEQSGGAIMDLSVHDYDALNWLLGTPKTVYSRGKIAKPGLWNHALTLVDYGATNGYVEGSPLLPKDFPFTATLKVLCEHRSVEYF